MKAPTFNRELLINFLQSSRPSSSRLLRLMRNPLKNCIIALSRLLRLENELVVRLVWGDRFFGILPEAVTSLLWRYGCYEAQTSLFLTKYLDDGDTFLDIGAHFGYFSILASRLVGPNGQVISIEAMPRTFACLKRNITENSLANVKAVNFAASDRQGELTFTDFGMTNSSLNTASKARGGKSEREDSGIKVTVTSEQVDVILSRMSVERVNIVKVDAESSEELVLLGMQCLLTQSFPVVIVELGGGDKSEDIRTANISNYMSTFGYNLYKYDRNLLTEVRNFEVVPYMNGFFIHTSQLAKFYTIAATKTSCAA